MIDVSGHAHVSAVTAGGGWYSYSVYRVCVVAVDSRESTVVSENILPWLLPVLSPRLCKAEGPREGDNQGRSADTSRK